MLIVVTEAFGFFGLPLMSHVSLMKNRLAASETDQTND